MKKFLLIALVPIIIAFFVVRVNASDDVPTTTSSEEIVETTSEETSTALVEENVKVDEKEEVEATFVDQLNDFCDKWLAVILAFVDGVGGSALMILLFVKKINKKIEMHEAITKEDTDEAIKIVLETKDSLVKATEEVNASTEEMKKDFEVLKEAYQKEHKECENMRLECETMKALLAKAVSLIPQFASSGVAQEIIEMCKTVENEEGVEDNE